MDRFIPLKAQKALLKAKIKPGSIIYIFCDFIDDPHNKYILVNYCDKDIILVFFINTEIHPLIDRDPNQRACQIKLTQVKYPFLDHDSHLNCTEVIEGFDWDTIIDHLLVKGDDYKGELLKDDIVEVLVAVNSTKTISNFDKKLIMDALGN